MEMIRKYFTRFSTGWFRITRVISSFGRFYKKVGILLGGFLAVKNLWGVTPTCSNQFSTTISALEMTRFWYFYGCIKYIFIRKL